MLVGTPPDADSIEDHVIERIRACMQSALKLTDAEVAAIGPDATALEVPGWNSLGHVHLIIELERTFDVTFEADEIAGLASVAAIRSALDRPA
jgi:acyl carrier protein